MIPNVTLKELAFTLGVSISTVSKALSDSTEISKQTKKRVVEAAELYNYRPNSMAQNLRLQKTNTIGLIVPDLSNVLTLQLLDEITNCTIANQTKLMVYQSKGDSNKEKDLIKMLTNGSVDGLIISLSHSSMEKKLYTSIQHLVRHKFPLVLLNNVDEISCSKVFISKEYNYVTSKTTSLPHQLLGQEAVKILLKMVCKKAEKSIVKCLEPNAIMFRKTRQHQDLLIA